MNDHVTEPMVRLPEGDGADQGDFETPTPQPTEPAVTTTPSTAPAVGTGTWPQTSGIDPWLAATFLLVAVLAIVSGTVMCRRARTLGTRW